MGSLTGEYRPPMHLRTVFTFSTAQAAANTSQLLGLPDKQLLAYYRSALTAQIVPLLCGASDDHSAVLKEPKVASLSGRPLIGLVR